MSTIVTKSPRPPERKADKSHSPLLKGDEPRRSKILTDSAKSSTSTSPQSVKKEPSPQKEEAELVKYEEAELNSFSEISPSSEERYPPNPFYEAYHSIAELSSRY